MEWRIDEENSLFHLNLSCTKPPTKRTTTASTSGLQTLALSIVSESALRLLELGHVFENPSDICIGGPHLAGPWGWRIADETNLLAEGMASVQGQ